MHILQNYSLGTELYGLACGWRERFGYRRPDLSIGVEIARDLGAYLISMFSLDVLSLAQGAHCRLARGRARVTDESDVELFNWSSRCN